MKKEIIINIISTLFIFLFVYTSVSKFNDIGQFQAVLKKSPLLGTSAIAISWIIPSLELLISAALFIPAARLIGLISSFVLMLLFSGYIAYMLLFEVKLPCACGGVLRQMNWSQHLLFNSAFVLLGLWGIWLSKCKPVHQTREEPSPVIFT